MARPRGLPPSRRGVALLVVILLLTLFALVGLSFVLYADAAADRARITRESQSPSTPDVDPELLFAYFLGQLIYDVPDDGPGVYSALRGHSLARNLYGANFGRGQPAANVVPFNGVGRLHGDSPFGKQVLGPSVDDAQLLNYTYYPNDPQLPPLQRFLRDPERLGWRPANLTASRGPYTGGFNGPYTYPDLNTTFLAAVRADGAVLLPSFHRPWASAVADFPADAGEFFNRDTALLNPFWSPDAVPPPWFKYTTLRPLPALNPGFPAPEDGGGDVKNLAGGPGTLRRISPETGRPEYWNNDSFWLDLGFPVLVAPDGRKYKPLFAALVTDLDNRINVNVHGNTRGTGGEHCSNQGWGPWEVNVGRVLTEGTEWQRLLAGSARPAVQGRYGGVPWANKPGTPGTAGELAPPGPLPHFYAQVDLDGGNEITGGPSAPLGLPGFGGASLSAFPSYLTPAGGPGGYGNGSEAERRNHPLLANPFWPAGDDRAFAASNLEALLRYGDHGSPALTSDLFRLCPANFRNPRVRGLVTTHSMDLDRPGVSPWVQDPAAYPYTSPPTEDPDNPGVPEGPVIPFPSLASRGPGPFDSRLAQGDFGAVDWRGTSAPLGRINLNRPLPPYPHQGSGLTPPFGPPLTLRDGQVVLDIPFDVDAPDGTIWKQFVAAQEARQRLANDLYRRLLVVAGVAPLSLDQDPEQPPAALLAARRWLAQLAVNIVDYLDEDDISTPFCFYTAEDYQHLPVKPSSPPDPARVDPARSNTGPDGEIQWPLYWVFGTELPRLVVNEALAEAEKTNADEAYAAAVRVFVELHNPFLTTVPAGTQQTDRLPVPLRVGDGTAAHAPYRLVVGVKSPVPWRPNGAAVAPSYDNDNVLGNPDLAVMRSTLSVAGPGMGVVPQGFLLLGPPEEAPDPFPEYDPFAKLNSPAGPNPASVTRTPSLEYVRFFPIRQPYDPPDERSEGVTVLLRRLANPYLRFDGRRGVGTAPNLTYNPYVTVDYLEDIPVLPVTGDVRRPLASRGKLQPYAAHRSQLRDQTPGPIRVRHTFGRSNVPTPERYDWLAHLDRPLSSPLELLHVSGYQPYQLTQRFIHPDESGQPVKSGHRVPWFDEDQLPGTSSHRLYRLFEFLETGPLSAGGRLPGKVNLNTVWDPEVFRALADAQPSNHFQEADVDAAFARFLYDRRPAPLWNPLRRTQGHVPGANDRPFRGLAPGSYPPGDQQVHTGGGVEDTFFRLRQTVPGTHPYLDHGLLTKLGNHVTTRSNVFAVWLTVGFFEVTDDSTRPVQLGAELGRAENRHIRHRMFALLDRTNLSIASFVASLTRTVSSPSPWPFPLVPQTVSVNGLEGTTILPVAGPGISWRIDVGSTLVVGVGAEQECVEVLAVDLRSRPPTITAVFTKSHAAGTALSLADTPGPPPVFLKPLAVASPDPVPPLPYTVAVRLLVDPARSSATALAGAYDGIPWVIRPGARLLVSTGPEQEVVTVENGPFDLDGGRATGSFRVRITRAHADGFLLTNTLLGNPGPQPRFDPRAPAAAAVVRHLSIIR